MERSKDSVEEYCGQTTAISGKRQEMGSELACPTPHTTSQYSGIYPLILMPRHHWFESLHCHPTFVFPVPFFPSIR